MVNGITEIVIALGVSFGLPLAGAAALAGLYEFLERHPPKSLIRNVEKHEALYCRKHGSVPQGFPPRPKRTGDLYKRFNALRYMTQE